MAIFGMVCLTLLGGVWGCQGPPPDTSHDLDPVPIADFTLTERSGKQVSRADLLGKVWAVSFVFTRCGGPCPQITSTMAELQHHLAGQNNVVLITITVDPAHDTPAVLNQYADSFRADPERWLFLTGKENEIHELIQKSFITGVKKNQGDAVAPGNEVTHGSRIILVDKAGQRRAQFDGRRADEEGKPVNNAPAILDKIRFLAGE